MNDGVMFGAIISGFAITWGWLVKISYTLGKVEQKLEDVVKNGRKRRK